MLGLAVLLGLGNWIGPSDRPPTVSSPARFDTHLLELDAATTVRRPNYNYSVIPGGAFTGHELQRAVDRDAVVAEHYSDVNASTMRPDILKADRMAYVSYRLGSRVYWTSKKVRIRSGETILTNGQTQIRARCGNCISMEPLMPTSADEPDAMQLDALSDSGPMQLEALNDTGPVLMAWPLNPLVPVPPGGPVGVELAPSVTPQFGLPLFPVPSGFSEPTAGDRGDVDPGSPTPGAPFDAGPGERVDTSMPTGVVPPAGAVPPGGTPAAGTDPSTSTGPTGQTGPGFSGDGPFPPDPPDPPLSDPTTRVIPPTPPDDPTPVPEPATLLLVGGGIAGLIARRWRSGRS